MNSLKSVCPFLALLALPISVSLAQVSSTTATQPASTTSGNRMQELYDQYHGVSKKPATTSTSTTTAPPTMSTSGSTTSPQRRSTDYGSSQPVTSRQPRTMTQEANVSGTRIGLRGGATYTFFTEEVPLIKSSTGFVGGLTFNFGAGTFSFQPEINYARYVLKASDDFSGLSVKAAGDVIEVPLFLKIASGTYDGNRFFVNVSPYGSYLASISQDGKKQPIDDSVNRFGFGAALGIGAALKAGPGHVTIEARGLYSLGDTNNGFNTDSRAINSQLTVGYSFPLGSR